MTILQLWQHNVLYTLKKLWFKSLPYERSAIITIRRTTPYIPWEHCIQHSINNRRYRMANNQNQKSMKVACAELTGGSLQFKMLCEETVALHFHYSANNFFTCRPDRLFSRAASQPTDRPAFLPYVLRSESLEFAWWQLFSRGSCR